MAERKSSTFQAGPDRYSVETYANPGASGKSPAVVLLHGTDGLEGESGTEIPKFAEQIADAGFVVFVPEYFGPDNLPGLPPALVFERRINSVGSYAPRIAAAVDHACADPRVDGKRLGWWDCRLSVDSRCSTPSVHGPNRLTRLSTSSATLMPGRACIEMPASSHRR